jgi:hypothetical protein
MSAEAELDNTFCAPIRISITLPYCTHRHLQARSHREGRSLSNLAAFILTEALRDHPTL